MINLRDKILKSQIAYYTGLIAKHQQNVEIYLNQPVGIGEHSKILDEIHIWTHQLSESEENIQSLKKHFEDDGYVRDKPIKGVLNG